MPPRIREPLNDEAYRKALYQHPENVPHEIVTCAQLIRTTIDRIESPCLFEKLSFASIISQKTDVEYLFTRLEIALSVYEELKMTTPIPTWITRYPFPGAVISVDFGYGTDKEYHQFKVSVGDEEAEFYHANGAGYPLTDLYTQLRPYYRMPTDDFLELLSHLHLETWGYSYDRHTDREDEPRWLLTVSCIGGGFCRFQGFGGYPYNYDKLLDLLKVRKESDNPTFLETERTKDIK